MGCFAAFDSIMAATGRKTSNETLFKLNGMEVYEVLVTNSHGQMLLYWVVTPPENLTVDGRDNLAFVAPIHEPEELNVLWNMRAARTLLCRHFWGHHFGQAASEKMIFEMKVSGMWG